jgi:hypothetical protein
MILRISAALVCLLFVVSSASAQCSNCAQGPVFAQSAAAPVYYNSVSYAQPMSQMQMVYTAAPVSSGCGSCGQTSAIMPASTGCSGCAQTAAPIGTYTSAPVSTGCASCAQTVMVQPTTGTYTSMAPISNCSSCAQIAVAQPACGSCNTGCTSCAQPVSTSCCNAPCATCDNTSRTRWFSIGARRGSRCCN